MSGWLEGWSGVGWGNSRTVGAGCWRQLGWRGTLWSVCTLRRMYRRPAVRRISATHQSRDTLNPLQPRTHTDTQYSPGIPRSNPPFLPRRTGLADAVGADLGVITASNYGTIKHFPTAELRRLAEEQRLALQSPLSGEDQVGGG